MKHSNEELSVTYYVSILNAIAVKRVGLYHSGRQGGGREIKRAPHIKPQIFAFCFVQFFFYFFFFNVLCVSIVKKDILL